MTAIHTAARQARQSYAVVAANQQMQRRRAAQALLTHQLAAAVAEQEGIALDVSTEATFLASIRGLSEAQRLRLQWRVATLMVGLGALLAPLEVERQVLGWTHVMLALAEVLALLSGSEE